MLYKLTSKRASTPATISFPIVLQVDEIVAVLSQALEEMGTRIDITLLRNKSISVKTTRTGSKIQEVCLHARIGIHCFFQKVPPEASNK